MNKRMETVYRRAATNIIYSFHAIVVLVITGIFYFSGKSTEELLAWVVSMAVLLGIGYKLSLDSSKKRRRLPQYAEAICLRAVAKQADKYKDLTAAVDYYRLVAEYHMNYNPDNKHVSIDDTRLFLLANLSRHLSKAAPIDASVTTRALISELTDIATNLPYTERAAGLDIIRELRYLTKYVTIHLSVNRSDLFKATRKPGFFQYLTTAFGSVAWLLPYMDDKLIHSDDLSADHSKTMANVFDHMCKHVPDDDPDNLGAFLKHTFNLAGVRFNVSLD